MKRNFLISLLYGCYSVVDVDLEFQFRDHSGSDMFYGSIAADGYRSSFGSSFAFEILNGSHA